MLSPDCGLRCPILKYTVTSPSLRSHGGSRTLAAKELDISRRTLHRKLNEYGLHEPDAAPPA